MKCPLYLITTATAEFGCGVNGIWLVCAGRSILGTGLADWSPHIWRWNSALLSDEAETNSHCCDTWAAFSTICTCCESWLLFCYVFTTRPNWCHL